MELIRDSIDILLSIPISRYCVDSSYCQDTYSSSRLEVLLYDASMISIDNDTLSINYLIKAFIDSGLQPIAVSIILDIDSRQHHRHWILSIRTYR